MNEPRFLLLVVSLLIIQTGVGFILGQKKGRALDGAILGFLFSCLGWLLILIFPARSAKAKPPLR